jgi:benzoylformate decarboxylase
MAMTTVHDATYEVLRSLGLTTIVGNPGSNELPFLDRLPCDFRYILALQEGAGLAMADGYSQATGRPVLVNLHAAAGVGQAMGSLVNAQVLGTPLVVMSGQQSRALLTLEGQLTNRDAIVLPRPLVKWSFEAPDAASVPAVIARAAQIAMAAPSGPVFVSVPLDDWKSEADPEHTALLTARQVASKPVPSAHSLHSLAERLNSAKSPLLVLGAELDTAEGWRAGINLAERCAAGVVLAIEPARISFPTRHANFLGTLRTSIAGVREQLTGHDLVIVVGAPAFRYHAWTPGAYLPEGAHLVLITSDPDLAARAPMGEAIVGDPIAAMEQLHRLVRANPRTLPRPMAPAVLRSHSGAEKVSVRQFNEVLAQVCPPNAVFTSEAPSLGSWWETVSINRPRSFFCGAAGALGFALPAAVGVSLADPERPVIALVGDGSANYSITGLWTAAQLDLPCTFVIVRNGVYQALMDYGSFLHAEGLPGMNLPGIDFVAVAAGYGVPGRRVSTTAAMAAALEAAIDSRKPSLLEVEVEATDSGMFDR